MRDKEYSKWLQSYVSDVVIKDYIKRCQRVEDNLHIDLDYEFSKDSGRSLLTKLTYTTEDQKYNRPLKCNIYFKEGADLRTGMGSLKTAVSKYFEFCQASLYPLVSKNVVKREVKQKVINSTTSIDSYKEMLNYFKIDKISFFEWGISSTIFPSVDRVQIEWENLKRRIFNNQTVFIRGYGRDAHGTDLFKDLYLNLLNNGNVKKDSSNNTAPTNLLYRMTGLKKNTDIYNYQVSHIWGRTKNIFMFEAPWNICYTPKIMDPFTGHESKGEWPIEYQELFIAKAKDLYKPFVDDYNEILKTLNVEKILKEYIISLKGSITEKELVQFSKDAIMELSPIL